MATDSVASAFVFIVASRCLSNVSKVSKRIYILAFSKGLA